MADNKNATTPATRPSGDRNTEPAVMPGSGKPQRDVRKDLERQAEGTQVARPKRDKS